MCFLFLNVCCVQVFEPLFIEVKRSRYANKFLFGSGITRDEAFGWRIESESDLMMASRESHIAGGGRIVLLPENPCDYGFFISGVRNG